MPDDPPKNESTVDHAAIEAELSASVAAIREGLADVQAGRVQPLVEAFADLRKELGIPEQSDQASGGR